MPRARTYEALILLPGLSRVDGTAVKYKKHDFCFSFGAQ